MTKELPAGPVYCEYRGEDAEGRPVFAMGAEILIGVARYCIEQRWGAQWHVLTLDDGAVIQIQEARQVQKRKKA